MQNLLKLAVLLLLVSSCNKKACYQCTTKTTQSLVANRDSIVDNKTANNAVCDMTEDNANDYEVLNSDSVVNGNLLMMKLTTCNKQ